MNPKESIKLIAKAILQMMIWPTQCAIVVLRLDGRLSDWHMMSLILPFMIGLVLMVVIGKITKEDERKLNHEMSSWATPEMDKKNTIRQHGIVDVSADQIMSGDVVLIGGKYRKVRVSSHGAEEGQVAFVYQDNGMQMVEMNLTDTMSVERVTNLDGPS